MSKLDGMMPWRLGAAQNLTITASSQQTTAAPAATYAVMLTTDTNCRVRVGVNPVAVTSDTLLKVTDDVLVVAIRPTEQVAVIGTAGNFSVTWLTH